MANSGRLEKMGDDQMQTDGTLLDGGHGHKNHRYAAIATAPASSFALIDPALFPAHLAALLRSPNGGSNTVPLQPQLSPISNGPSTNRQPAFPASSYHQRGDQQTLPGRIPNSQATFSAAAQVVAAHAAAAASSRAMTNALLPSIHTWSLEELEQHAKLLQQMNQPIPQSVALLIADARRKEKKKTAKRVANRKSACTSRARKKALVEEMTQTNARLRRQALILSLLPDLVIVVTMEGEITFCSAQVERVLRHSTTDLVGAKIDDILIPTSSTALRKLIEEHVSALPGDKSSRAKRKKRGREDEHNHVDSRDNKARREGNVNGSSGSNGASSGVVAIVSDQSFPLSVVKVKSKQEPTSDENDTSDISGSNGCVKQQVIFTMTNSTSTVRSPAASLGNSNSGSDDGARVSVSEANQGKTIVGITSKKRLSPQDSKQCSDDSSSGSMETKKVRQANQNLERNVRSHNRKLQNMSKSSKSKAEHKDDVIGAFVTANNASARLSSLQHLPGQDIGDQSSSEDSLLEGVEEKVEGLPEANSGEEHERENQEDEIEVKKKSNKGSGDHSLYEDSSLNGVEEKKKTCKNIASDDSGYRESNDSREETLSCASDSSNSKSRNKPLAPTCNVCLIRDDLTTIWCEVTSSVRTANLSGANVEGDPFGEVGGHGHVSSQFSATSKTLKNNSATTDDSTQGNEGGTAVMELLLCLRPIRDGETSADKSSRFIPPKRRCPLAVSETSCPEMVDVVVSAGINTPSAECINTKPSNTTSGRQNRPPKKRLHKSLEMFETTYTSIEMSQADKRNRYEEDTTATSSETEKSVVESLMLMSNKSASYDNSRRME